VLAGDRAVGIYGASARIVEGLVLVAGSFREAVYPILSRFWPSSPDPFRDASRTAFKFLVALAIPIGVGTSIVAYKLFPFIYGADYAEGWVVLAVLIWALVAIFIRELSAATLFAFNLQKLVLASNALGAATAVALNLLLIPHLSYLAPAIAGVTTAFATTAFNLVIIGTKMRNLYPWRLALRPVAAAAVMAAALALGWRWPVVLNVCGGAAVYGAALLATRYYRLSQFAELLRQR
jgi:O-antigen/teichoic acid export membrane protein